MKSVSTPHAPGIPTSAERAYIAVVRAADRIATRFAQWLKPYGLSPTQYNALRILRGAGADGLPCGDIGERMLTHDSDITRLVDRLEKHKLVARRRDADDRRVIRARITQQGLDVLSRLDGPLREFHARMFASLNPDRVRMLQEICDELAAAAEAGGSGEHSTPARMKT
jgi:DNA-binding MarR family transcriptional regulator